MSPKFRGNGEDWLDSDDEREVKRSAAKKAARPVSPRAAWLPASEGNATVAEVFPKQCRVIYDVGGSSLLCNYRRATVMGRESELRERSPVAVGDRVRMAPSDWASGVIDGVCERRNRLQRPAPGRDGTVIQHVIAANVDELAIVASTVNPDFSPGLVDRYLIAAAHEGIPATLILTKRDLLPPGEIPGSLYKKLGLEVHEVSARTGAGIEALRTRFTGRAVVYCGSSGVGKTSLLRVLLQREIGRVAELSASTGKGQHTTTGAILLGGPGNSSWIDTPGVREFGLTGVEPGKLKELFPELCELRCEKSGCMHRGEPGCLAEGEPRLASYRRILESLVAGT